MVRAAAANPPSTVDDVVRMLLAERDRLAPDPSAPLDVTVPGHLSVSQLVTLRVPRRRFEYWDEARGWVATAGGRPLYVGPSQRVTPLSAAAPAPG